jgi:hypothetical protein
MDRRNPPCHWGTWNAYDAMEIVITLATIAAVTIGWAAMASAQDAAPLDLSILAKLDAPASPPTAQAPRDTLDLSLLDRLDQPAATAPGDALDVTLLDALDAPTGKIAVKPSKAAMRALGAASGVDLGDEIGHSICHPAQPQAATSVNLRDNTINPPNSRIWNRPDDQRQALIEHLIGHPNHSPHGFTFNMLNRLDLATLERLHSNDHDHRLNLTTPTIAEAPRQSAATCPNGVCPVSSPAGQSGKMPPVAVSPPTWSGTRFYWPSQGQWRDSPQPGTNYPTMGGVLVPLASAPQAASVMRSPVVVRGGCPGGVCPVN